MKFIFYLFIIFVMLSSCKKNKKVIDINENVFVELSDSTNQSIELRVRTGEIYSCMNYPIVYSQQKIGSTIIIKFKGVEESDVCLTATGAATTEVDLGTLKKDRYNLKFKLNGKITKGVLTTSPYNLTIETGGNVLIK